MLEIITGCGIVLHADPTDPRQLARIEAATTLLGGVVFQHELETVQEPTA